MSTLLTVWGAIASAMWLLAYTFGSYHVAHLRRLREDGELPGPTPSLSVVVPARNESKALPETLDSLLALAPPSMEIVVVDDRSSDGTGAVADRYAEAEECVRALHVDQLPDDWLGKVHALHRGVAETEGDWILFTDADVRFSDDVLQRALAEAQDDGLDHLALSPRFVDGTLWHALAVDAFFDALLVVVPTAWIEDPEREAAAGVGAFNMVRRASLQRGEGLEGLRLEVAEDMAIGRLIKEKGGASRIASAPDALDVEWYRTAAEFVRGLEKSAFPKMAQYSLPRAFALLGLWLFALIGPFSALLSASSAVQTAGAAALASGMFHAWLTAGRLGRSRLRAPFWLVGQLIVMWAFVRSTYLCWRRGALVWRETEYSLDELRRHQRIRFL